MLSRDVRGLAAILTVPLLAATVLVADATAEGRLTDPDGPALFLANCARCHGVDGDGKGPEVLDRPARNFKDGGFSFGNTKQAIVRTLGNGIPGTPMPAFGETLGRAEIEALAEHVMSLAPAALEVSEAETLLAVTDHARVVRGLLPPVTEGAHEHPRGLLVGLPSGLTFEYDAEDVRLLGVRVGDFVRRADWTGRGGAPLEPLGQVLWLNGGGVPPPAFAVRRRGADDPEHVYEDTPVSTQLSRTELQAETARLAYEAAVGDGVREVVTETVGPATTSQAGGFRRELRLSGAGRDNEHLVFRHPLRPFPPEGEADPLRVLQAHGRERTRMLVVDSEAGTVMAVEGSGGTLELAEGWRERQLEFAGAAPRHDAILTMIVVKPADMDTFDLNAFRVELGW